MNENNGKYWQLLENASNNIIIEDGSKLNDVFMDEEITYLVKILFPNISEWQLKSNQSWPTYVKEFAGI